MKKRTLTRALSYVLALIMLLSMMPAVSVSAVTTDVAEVAADTDITEVAGTTADGFEYSIDNGKVTITKYTGSATELVIPAEIEGYPVVVIGERAFYDCEILTSIIIPEGVTYIGEYAFCDCDNLRKIVIPKTLKEISYGAFSGYDYLSEVHISDLAAWCNIKFGNNAGTPMTHSSGTPDLFINGEPATNVVIPEGVTALNDYVLGAGNIESVHIPASVTYISPRAFESYIKKITIDENNSKYDSRDNCNAIIETETNTLVMGFVSSVVPAGVTCIGERAFYDVRPQSMVLPEGVTKIDKGAFADCYRMDSIVLPVSLTNIEAEAFALYGVPSGVKDVYYCGTQEQWEKVTIGEHNEGILDATIHYNYVISTEPEPTEPVTTTPSEPAPTEPVVTDPETFVPMVTIPAGDIVTGVGLVLGDSDGDGKVNVKDATMIQKAVAGMITLSEVGNRFADVDGNGKVNVKDATAIQKWVAGIETGFDIGKEKTV